MLRSLEFTKDLRCFKAGARIEFRPGINMLVGDQGTGKSTILGIFTGRVLDAEKATQADTDGNGVHTRAFDFEQDNPRVSPHLPNQEGAFMAAVIGMWKSHGEFNLSLLQNLLTQEGESLLVLLDEPDQALSPRSCLKLVKILKQVAARGHQIVVSVHNPFLITSQDLVYSVEHMEWVTPDKFITGHRTAAKETLVQEDNPDWRDGIDMEIEFWTMGPKCFFVVCDVCDEVDSPDFPTHDEMMAWAREYGGAHQGKWLCKGCLEKEQSNGEEETTPI